MQLPRWRWCAARCSPLAFLYQCWRMPRLQAQRNLRTHLAAAGLHVHKLEFVFGTDLGQTAAHPLLLAAIAQPATRVDIAGGFAAARLPGA